MAAAGRQSKMLVVGSGITGCISASMLSRAGAKVTVWEKGGGVGGRMTTHRHPNDPSSHVDMGAQYITAYNRDEYDGAFQRLRKDTFADLASNGILSPLVGTIDGERSTGDAHYVSRDGLNSVAKHYLRSAGIAPQTHHTLSQVDSRHDQALCFTASGELHEFDAVILTMPVPQVLALKGSVTISIDPAILAKLQAVTYSSRYALGLFYDRHVASTWTAKYARDSPALRFLCWDDAKRASSSSPSPTTSALLAHSSVEFGREYLETDKAQVQDMMLKAVERECPHLPAPVHSHLIRWRYSQVTSGYPTSPGVEVLSRQPLVVVTGDAFSHSNFEGCLYAAQKTTDVVLSALGMQ